MLKHLQAAACVALTLASASAQMAAQPFQAAPQQQQGTPNAAQTGGQVSPTTPATAVPVQNDTTGDPNLPQAPAPKLTEPLYLRPTTRDYTEGYRFLPNPLLDYKAISYPGQRLTNTSDLRDLLHDGKIYMSLSDAVALALENNYDIAVARINLDIADTDILRAKAGSTLRGVSTSIVDNTLGGTTTTITTGGGPAGTTSSTAGTGASGLVLSTNGGGPAPEVFDPVLTGTVSYESSTTPQSTTVLTGTNTLNQKLFTWNAGYQQGFKTGTLLNVTFDNSRTGTNSERSTYSPLYQNNFKAQLTQHLLQGFGLWLNTRFIVQAKNNRRIEDSVFRQQVLYTVNQVENIYWAVVSAYEDEQAKERALQQSTQLANDNRKQLQIGTLAPLDVVNSDSTVATDKQSLITSQTNLEYQQLLLKQAVARNLNDPELTHAPVVPTDRAGLGRLPEEDMQVEDLVREAYENNPQIEQAMLNMKNNKITIRAEKNGLLPVVDAYGFYAGSGLTGSQNPSLNCNTSTTTNTFVPCASNYYQQQNIPTGGYGSSLSNSFSGKAPDWSVGVNISVPLRNRAAQADQVRSQMELRQSEMRLQQLYTQIRIQVVNAMYAITNDRASVVSAQSARDYQAQALEAEQKKYRLGASTTANVLQQERNLATAENTLISANSAFARDRSSLNQLLANTLDRYGITLQDATTGNLAQRPVIPGLTPPVPPAPPKPLTADPGPLQQ
ncbi:TolC family protein [Granulicella cerasi]|uniref:TolC family protein n=1 Tax=Granulicella cerasi TaxID=741063 RepID=A0ABW1Z624_9BACT|nr:TolC family protein [Granulicella cerasi]